MALANGHISEADFDRTKPSSTPAQSESELSEVHDLPGPNASSIPPTFGMVRSEDSVMNDMATSEIDDNEDAPGEEDADFANKTSPRSATSGVDHVRSMSSSTSGSQLSKKREPTIDDDDFIQQNPELYGLRRSGRARPSRQVIETSDDENENDEGDVSSGTRRKRRKVTSALPAMSRLEKKVSSSRPQSSLEDDSDEDDVYGGQRGRSFAKMHRRKRQEMASDHDAPPYGEVRFSTRRAAKVTNYNEDDDLDLSEEDTDNLTPNYGNYTEHELPGIDEVLNYRQKEGVEPDTEDKHDYEFYVKWQGQAHLHATWHPWSELNSRRGFRRLENYFRKTVKYALSMTYDPDVAPEEKEQWSLERERVLAKLNECKKVQRVIGTRHGDQGTEYYVKWISLYYDCCTWETAELVSQEAQVEIDRYLDRSSMQLTSDKNESNPNTRSAYKPFRSQPDYVKGGQLREFQIHGVNFLCHHWCKSNNVILADEMGLGKTVQTVSFMSWLMNDRHQKGPFIVVVPLTTVPAWADTFNYWAPDINYVEYTGNESARATIRDYELLVDGNPKKPKFNVLLTTYEYVLFDASFLSQIKWQFLAVDEAHRLKNRESQLYAKLMDFGAPSRLLITGTPMQNTLSELSALMDFLMPGKIHVEENIDLTSEHASRKLAELTDAISPYMIRRTKQKVENDIPPKTEKIIRVELSDLQLEYYKNILTRNYTALNAGAKAQKTSLLNVMMELKKASNHPFMFPNAEERLLAGNNSREEQLKGLITTSGKMMLLDQLLTKMKKDGHRVLIFSQMVKMLDILGDYLALRGHQFQRLDGTIAAGPRRMAIDHFNAPDSQDFCFLLSTRAGGLGINLMTADTVILFDSDWNPQADLQAMARAHRIGQRNPVTIYRLVSKDTIEEEVLERARNKLMLEFITIQRGVTDKGAQELGDRMARAGARTAEPTSSDDISRILKKRGQKMFEQSGNQKKLEELDIDAVLENAEEHKTEQPEGITTDGGEEFLRSFEYTDVKIDLEWDEIIPKEQLAKLKEEELKRQEAEYLERVIEQNAPRKRKAPGEEHREQRAAKKRARELTTEAAADADSNDEDSDAGRDPKRALSEKECRHLVRAYERYGAIEEKQDEIIKEARVIGRDVDVVKSTLQDIVDTAVRLQKEHADEVAELERQAQKPITKKEKKAILFDFRGVKRLNAQTLTERPEEMRLVRSCVNNTPDWRTFRVPEASKPASYTSPWGAKEDGMLCVGIARHGYGAWVQIRDDEELGLQDKFYLEEHRVGAKEERTKGGDEKQVAKSPGAVHLVRRSNYLLSVLKDKTSNGTNIAAKRALDNHHRNNRKSLGLSHGRLSTPTTSASPGPTSLRKSHVANDSEAPRHKHSLQSDTRRPPAHGPLNGHRKAGDNSKDKALHQSSDDRKKSTQPLHQSSDDRKKPLQSFRPSSDDRKKPSQSHHQSSDDRQKPHPPLPHSDEQRKRPLTSGPASLMAPPTTNGISKPLPKPLSEDDRKMRDFLAPIKDTLTRVSRVTRKHIPDNDERLKAIKRNLVAIGKHIESQVSKHGKYIESHASPDGKLVDKSLESMLWDYVSDHHWPQAKQEENRAPGHKLREMYLKISDKDSITAAAQEAPAKSRTPSDGAKTPTSNGDMANTKKELSTSGVGYKGTMRETTPYKGTMKETAPYKGTMKETAPYKETMNETGYKGTLKESYKEPAKVPTEETSKPVVNNHQPSHGEESKKEPTAPVAKRDN